MTAQLNDTPLGVNVAPKELMTLNALSLDLIIINFNEAIDIRLLLS